MGLIINRNIILVIFYIKYKKKFNFLKIKVNFRLTFTTRSNVNKDQLRISLQGNEKPTKIYKQLYKEFDSLHS